MRLANITWPQAQAYFKENDMVLIGIGNNGILTEYEESPDLLP
jgi:hypothetical protein